MMRELILIRLTIKLNPKVKEIVLVADKSLLMSEINKVLFILKKNEIKNIKLLSNRNAN